MYLLEILRVAFQSILANFFRAALTMLGIIIGVAAVITMVAVGSGAQRAVREQIESLGADILNVESERPRRGGVSRDQVTMTVEDAAALVRDSRYLQAVVPEISEREQVKFGNSNQNTTIIATTPNFVTVRNFELDRGRLFTAADDAGKRRVAVIGSSVAGDLGVKPEAMLGNTLLIRNLPFEVIGILKEKGSMGYNNPDDDIFIPLSTGQYRVFGRDRLEEMNVQVAEGAPMGKAMVEIERILRREHRIPPGQPNDFEITDRRMFLDTAQEATRIFTLLLASIASVSLLVGGIGIMNIMLVSVTERTKEIGIRIALGATRTNILLQFLVESMALCLLGGVIGIAAGFGASHLMNTLAGWQSYISPASVLVAFVFSAAVGLIFGIWPARRAAYLNPIDALRYE